MFDLKNGYWYLVLNCNKLNIFVFLDILIRGINSWGLLVKILVCFMKVLLIVLYLFRIIIRVDL